MSIEWNGYDLIRKDLNCFDLGVVIGQKKNDMIDILFRISTLTDRRISQILSK